MESPRQLWGRNADAEVKAVVTTAFNMFDPVVPIGLGKQIANQPTA
jgi:hypothetical protein